MMTPAATNISSSRIGKSAPAAMVYGMVNIRDRVMVPFGPPKVMIAAERHRSGVMRRRRPVCWSRAMRSMAATHTNRMATTTTDTSAMIPSSMVLLSVGSAHVVPSTSGSIMPSMMNTEPLSANESTAHTLDDTMLVRATFGPTPLRSYRAIRPAATTARTPDTPIASAPRYSRNGRNNSIRMRDVVVSQPNERISPNSQLAKTPNAKPSRVPPRKETTNSPAAAPTENVPVVAARIENWNPTMPEASLNRDSPSRIPCWRSLRVASWLSDVTATASVGPSAAPSARAAASGTAGQAACVT